LKLFSLALLLLISLPSQAATRFALLIGNNVGDINDGALRWAEEDARRLHDLLIELGDVAKGRAILLQGVTQERVHSALARLRGQVEEANRHGFRSEVLVFYSGHGDAEALHFGSTRFPLSNLKSLIQAIPADTSITIIDACRSGVLRAGRVKGAVHGPAFDISLAREPGPAGHVWITSAGIDEIAQESDELRSSFFSHHLLSGLRGAADTDSDDQVTLAELYRYVYHHTLSSSHGETAAVQHPEMQLELEGEGEVIMTVLKRSSSILTLPQGIGGDFLIVDDRNGHVFAEVRKPIAQTRKLALPSGRYRIQLRQSGRIFAGEIALEWGGKLEINQSMLVEQPLVAALTKGSELDPESWSISSGGLAGSPTVLGTGVSYGGALGVEHHVSGWPIFLLANLQLTHASASNEAWQYRHFETRITTGIGYAYYLGPVRLSVSLTLGVLFVKENAQRVDSDRIEAISGAVVNAKELSIGPCISPGIGIRIPVHHSWAIALGFEVQAAIIKIAGSWSNTVALLGQLGLEYKF